MATSNIIHLSSSPPSSGFTITPPCRSKRLYSSWSSISSPVASLSQDAFFHELDTFNIPPNSPGFTTVSNRQQNVALQKIVRLGDEVGQVTSNASEKASGPQKRKRATKDSGTLVKKSRAPRKSKVKENVGHDQANKEIGGDQNQGTLRDTEANAKPKVRKPRTKKADLEQGKLPKKVTKATALKSQHFHANSKDNTDYKSKLDVSGDETAHGRAAEPEACGLGLEKAPARRVNWTPTKPYDSKQSLDARIEEQREESAAADADGKGRQSSFCRDFYECLPQAALVQSNGVNGLTKKGQIQLITIGNQPLVSSTNKVKKSPKKPQTVTAKATEQFQPERLPSSSILDYLDSTNDDLVSIRAAVTAVQQSRGKTQRSRKTSKLLPPGHAMKAVYERDLEFGTSSQLMRGTSPARQHVPPNMDSSLPEIKETLRILPSRLSKSTSNILSRGLWDAAARDKDGTLLQVEKIDLSEMPEVLQYDKQTIPNIVDSPVDEQVAHCSHIPQHAISDDLEIPRPKSVAEAALRMRPKNKSPIKQSETSKPTLARTAKSMPKYETFTIIKLQKALESYGFKAIKKRETMISILQQCWESKQRLVNQNLPMNNPQPAPMLEEPDKPTVPVHKPNSKKRGRPVKAKDAVESAPKPRGRPRKATTQSVRAPLPSIPPPMLRAPSLPPIDLPPLNVPKRPITPPKNPKHLSLAQTELYPAIKTAIMSFPPTHDHNNLSWHEKILLYDPICVEDLAAWLNLEGLNKISVDEEVSAKTVKAWCESNSICCLIKGEGWRAKRTKASGVGRGNGRRKKVRKDIEVEEEVEPA